MLSNLKLINLKNTEKEIKKIQRNINKNTLNNVNESIDNVNETINEKNTKKSINKIKNKTEQVINDEDIFKSNYINNNILNISDILNIIKILFNDYYLMGNNITKFVDLCKITVYENFIDFLNVNRFSINEKKSIKCKKSEF
tara:strand:- start:1122 stop:1547 length:426 start_codon:yes stop_codon:yes gene_type:complete